jgi:hypothetical protein
MLVIKNGIVNGKIHPNELVGKGIIIDKYLSPDEAGKQIAKRIGKIVSIRDVFSKKEGRIVSLFTVEYEENNHYGEKSISAYHLYKIEDGAILSV